jgi:hypothetical protein
MPAGLFCSPRIKHLKNLAPTMAIAWKETAEAARAMGCTGRRRGGGAAAHPAILFSWLMHPHPPMPGNMLSRKQVDDIITYLNTLAVQ